MADYLLSRAAGKVLENLRDDIATQIVSKLETLQVGAPTRGSRKKRDSPKAGPTFYFRAGNYRVFYAWENRRAVVLSIETRQGAYKRKR